jgi:hypothetical protein
MIAVSILGNNITHTHTYVIVVLCVPVATHLPSNTKMKMSVSSSCLGDRQNAKTLSSSVVIRERE